MQKFIEHLISKLPRSRHTRPEILIYLQGVLDVLEALGTYLDESSMESEVTDPLYAYTWNDVVGRLSLIISETAEHMSKVIEDYKEKVNDSDDG